MRTILRLRAGPYLPDEECVLVAGCSQSWSTQTVTAARWPFRKRKPPEHLSTSDELSPQKHLQEPRKRQCYLMPSWFAEARREAIAGNSGGFRGSTLARYRLGCLCGLAAREQGHHGHHPQRGTERCARRRSAALPKAEASGALRRYAHFAPEQLRAAADKLGTFSYTPPKSETLEATQAHYCPVKRRVDSTGWG
jgi:hypothetical protein